MGQAREGAANDGAADAEYLAERFLAQLGAGGQALFEDGVEDVGVDDLVLGTAAGSLAGARRLPDVATDRSSVSNLVRPACGLG